MDTFSHVPPGFRFHPTDEELVDYYLRKKVTSRRIDLDVIKEIDLYKIEPWDLQELCRIGNEEQNEWYFFSHKDKKYPTGTRTNRATAAGFWKATGRDKAIYSKHELIGMRKTLVFYKGRAPNGQKSDWIMHEYRLETDENGAPQEEGWVVCRVFKKRIATMRKVGEQGSPMWYDDQVSFMPDMDSPKLQSLSDLTYNYHYSCKKELELSYHVQSENFLQLPLLESPKLLAAPATSMSFSTIPGFGLNTSCAAPLQASIFTQSQMHHSLEQNLHAICANNNSEQTADQVRDWRLLDKFVASQLSQGDVSKENDYTNAENTFHDADDPKMIIKDLENQEMVTENGSTPSSSCQRDIWISEP